MTDAAGISVISSRPIAPLHRLTGSFESSHFSSQGLLWVCSRLDSENVKFELWDPGGWTCIAETAVSDPYGDSAFHFLAHPALDSVVAWAAAGQDGQCLYWTCIKGGSIVVERFLDLDDTSWPSFNPGGTEFIVISSNELRRYRYPHGPVKALMPWPLDGQDPADSVSHVNANQALMASTNGRLFLVDLMEMKIEDEVSIGGHEPKPISTLYPQLEDPELGTDMSFFLRIAWGHFLSVHRDTKVSHPEESCDRLLTWRVS